MCGPLNIRNVVVRLHNMDPHMRTFWPHILLLAATVAILIQCSSSTILGTTGEEEPLYTLVEDAENHLAYPSRSYGYP